MTTHHLVGAELVDPSTDALPTAVREDLAVVGGYVYAIDPQFSDTHEFAQRYQVPLDRCANTIVTASGKGENKSFALCLVPASRRLNTKPVQALLGGRTSFAKPDDAAAATGMQFGAITPIGLLGLEHLPILVPPELFDRDWVVVGAGVRDLKIVLRPESLRPHVTVIEGLIDLS